MAGIGNADRTRQWLAERIRQAQAERAEKVQALQRQFQSLENERAELAQQLSRALDYDPGNGTCPRCAILRGFASRLEPIALAAVGGDPDPGPDVTSCPACMWDDTVTM